MYENWSLPTAPSVATSAGLYFAMTLVASTHETSLGRIVDVSHVTAQGIIAGANMVLVDFHPRPEKVLVDGPQALRMDELPYFLEDVAISREAYKRRLELREKQDF